MYPFVGLLLSPMIASAAMTFNPSQCEWQRAAPATGEAVSGILGEMVRRCLSLVIALVMAGAPGAVNVCQLVCADSASSPASPAGHDHAASHHAGADQGLHLAPMTHPCEHGDGVPAPPTVSAANVHTPLPLVPALAGTLLNPLRVPRAYLASSESSPPRPLEIRLVLPLRI